MEPKKLTVPDIGRMKAAGERISMVTAYDCPFARLLDEAGVDILLVGDSLGMVVQGLETTLPVTLDEIVYHTRMVARGRRRALVLGDLPFGSYQASPMRAVESAIPTIGIGAGAHCDGQVLVLHDLLGLSSDWTPRFAKRYAELGREVVRAASAYVEEVKGGLFPTEAQAFGARAAKAG